MDLSELFSPNIATRYKASLMYGQKNTEPFSYWPRGCWGAANGWLMVCGPSPGKADDPNHASSGGAERPKDVLVRIGKEAGKIDFQSNKARTKRWRSLVYAVFGDEEKGDCLTCVANLDWGNFGDHKKIDQTHLKAGCAAVFELMQASKPCVVITLVAVTWRYLSDYLHPFL